MGFSYRISSFRSYSHDSDLVTILCIGESSTIGYGVRPGMNYPAQLNRLLNGQKEKKRYFVTYDGDMGANSSQIMLRFSKSMEKYKPHKVIAMIGVNNRFNLDKSNMIRFTGERYFPKLYFRFWRFFHRFRVFKLGKILFYRITKYTGEARNPYLLTDLSPDHVELVRKQLQYDLLEMIRICKANNIQIILAGYPMGPHRELHRKLAKENDLLFVDNAGSFEIFKLEGTVTQYLLPDGWHPNGKGYSVVAQNIYNAIK